MLIGADIGELKKRLGQALSETVPITLREGASQFSNLPGS